MLQSQTDFLSVAYLFKVGCIPYDCCLGGHFLHFALTVDRKSLANCFHVLPERLAKEFSGLRKGR